MMQHSRTRLATVEHSFYSPFQPVCFGFWSVKTQIQNVAFLFAQSIALSFGRRPDLLRKPRENGSQTDSELHKL